MTSILTANTELSVAVVIEGVSGTGLRVLQPQSTDFGPNGETGITTGTVRVSSATFAKPERGATIRIGGEPAVITQVDGGVALWAISYRMVRQVEGE